jgi:hypothetical protein
LADPWELICHHTYAGVPGVIADLSPVGIGHGRGIGLPSGDFQSDGEFEASGAVNLARNGGWIEIPQSRNWGRIGGIKLELRTYLEPDMGLRGILSGTPFDFYINDGQITCIFGIYVVIPGIVWHSVVSTTNTPGFQLPTGRWITLGLINDGQGYSAITIDGAVVAEARQSKAVSVFTNLRIGQSRWSDDEPLNGRIDDLKIWRIDPKRINREFLNRPIDSATSDCLKRWLDDLRDALEDDVECGQLLPQLALAAVNRMITDSVEHSPEARQRIEQAVREYQRLWAANDLGDELVQVIVELSDWLAQEGIPVTGSPEFQALMDSPCIRAIGGNLPPLDCDPQFKSFLTQLAVALASSRIGASLNNGESRA